MFRTVWWIACASPEMEFGFTRECRVLSGIVGSPSTSQMWLPSHVRATTSDGRRNGSRRSMSLLVGWVRNQWKETYIRIRLSRYQNLAFQTRMLRGFDRRVS